MCLVLTGKAQEVYSSMSAEEFKSYIKKEVEIAVQEELPVWGVHIILGNDLVPDGCLWPDDKRPVCASQNPTLVQIEQQQLPCHPVAAPLGGVVETPVSMQTDLSCSLDSVKVTVLGPEVPPVGAQQPDEGEDVSSTVCAVTRAMAAALPYDLVQEQKKDSSLKDLYALVVPSNLAFTQVNELLSSAPVLAAPRLDHSFTLQVDASDVGAGAVLLQADEKGVEKPVCFLPKKFKGCFFWIQSCWVIGMWSVGEGQRWYLCVTRGGVMDGWRRFLQVLVLWKESSGRIACTWKEVGVAPGLRLQSTAQGSQSVSGFPPGWISHILCSLGFFFCLEKLTPAGGGKWPLSLSLVLPEVSLC
ncbi:uncharacterized protein LOC118470435 [Amphiprion ocellaris]|uniref:uncharacterized protein LOC118470435 n=1 Tax=Amphiprion ocellaris TaxID=80972 RepID=UPI002410CAEC|nr:uncharacterized protein LOC118470435 [Amphiprion ocellaris]